MEKIMLAFTFEVKKPLYTIWEVRVRE